MSPFLNKQDGAQTYKGRVHDRAGRRYIRSLGTRNLREAKLVEAFCTERRDKGDWRTLDAIIAGRVSALEAWRSSIEGTLTAKLEQLDKADEEKAEPDVDALVREWSRSARSAKYVTQVRTLVTDGVRFPLSQFTRARVSKHLAGLECADPTRNRYRVAFSQFCRWLVERDVIAVNFVRDVRGFRENDPRMVYYKRGEAKRLIYKLAAPSRQFEAFMVGAGLEVSAVLELRKGDVNLETREVRARGTKNRWRNRTVRVTEDWAWEIIRRAVEALRVDEAKLFAGMTERRALEAHVAACEAAKVATSTLHDWRHTYAIQALTDGIPPQTVKRQLGHSPHSTMLERVYAAWIPATDEDYRPRLATKVATSEPKTPTESEAQ